MQLQTAWYPERYPDRAIWRQDVDAMLDMGIAVVRLGEFAWMDMEPQPGVYRWDWLDEALDLLHARGLRAMLCTPTACPPIWLTEAHSEVLPVNGQRQHMVHGKRQHRCYTSPAYREAAERITEALGARYGRHPALVAWQLDNELGGERQHCHCDHCAGAFADWLRQVYGDIDTLNACWGTQFWSQTYQRFDQVSPPHAIDMQLKNPHHPSLMLAYWRHQSDAIAGFAAGQAAILRRHSTQPITTNTDTFALGDTVDVFHLFEAPDIAAIDIYTENPVELAFYCDLMRAAKGEAPFWILEHGVRSDRLPDALALAQAHGATMFGLFKLRAFAAGQEQGQDGLLSLTGNPLPGYARVKAFAAAAGEDPPLPRYPIGVTYDFPSAWSHDVCTRAEGPARFGYAHRVVQTVYPAAYALAGGAHIVRSDGLPEDVRVLLAPDLSMHTPRWDALLRGFVSRGGVLIADTNLLRRDADNVFRSTPPPFYTELLGTGDYIEPAAPNRVACCRQCASGQVLLLSPDAPHDVWMAVASQFVAGGGR